LTLPRYFLSISLLFFISFNFLDYYCSFNFHLLQIQKKEEKQGEDIILEDQENHSEGVGIFASFLQI